MNTGKANATTPAEQAIVELEAKVVIKKKEGYSETMPSDKDTIIQATIDLDNIPEEFCPNKPISKAPDKIVNGKDTYGQRKYNGHCLFLVKGKKTEKIYSRRMENMTSCLKDLPPIKEMMSKLSKGSFVLTETVFFEKSGKESTRKLSSIIRQKEHQDVMDRYAEFSKEGELKCIPFDVLFLDHQFIGDKDYLARTQLLKDMSGIEVPITWSDWKKRRASAEKDGWEGFVLRAPGKSAISYTMDGEAHRAGSYKYKFVKSDDFFVTEWLKGISGKHAAFYAKFKVKQYNSDGELIDRGYVGPGKLTHEELEQLTKDIDAQKVKKNFVVEVEYQDIQDSGKLQFGIIQRLRPDKTAKECVSDD